MALSQTATLEHLVRLAGQSAANRTWWARRAKLRAEAALSSLYATDGCGPLISKAVLAMIPRVTGGHGRVEGVAPPWRSPVLEILCGSYLP